MSGAEPIQSAPADQNSKFSASALPIIGWNVINGSIERGRQPVSSSTSRAAATAGSSAEST